ncbi:hypothetical protein [Nocardia cyriacigeorgica]|uniref:hypothetical protein n=1 Tax=Nocardia cyriacigeorgica TaxID=135487 RepID=UPI002458E95A|nr:hypothetical protein [Nocardia cyriacigeorgica]
MTHTIVVVGLGATGLAMAESLLRRTDVRIVGAQACGAVVGHDGFEQTISAPAFESFVSTIAAAANVATAIVDAPPGLLSMGDLPVARIASKGTHLAEAESL